jgi:hypothetical protein
MVTHAARHAALADRIVQLRDGRLADDQPLPAGRPDPLRTLESLS